MTDQFIDFQKSMSIRNFSLRTQKLYSFQLKRFLNYCRLNFKEINSFSFKDFIYSLQTENKLSTATLKQSIGAVKFFFAIH